MGRRKRADLPTEGVWFVTTTVAGSRPVFADPEAAQAALRELDRYAKQHKVRLFEYAIMPSHIHLIVQTSADGGGVSEFMRDLKRSIAYECRYECRKHWRDGVGFWSARFDDLFLTEGETLRVKADYVRWNPVKAGLCQAPEEYPYSSAWARVNPSQAVCAVDDYDVLW